MEELYGEWPVHSGEVKTCNQDGTGSIAPWKNKKENEKQPEYTAIFSFYNGEKKLKISAWSRVNRQEKEEPKDTMTKFCES